MERVGRGRGRGACAWASRVEARKVRSLSRGGAAGLPVVEDASLVVAARGRGGPGVMLPLASQGFEAIALDFAPRAFGARAALRPPEANCSKCPFEVWTVEYPNTIPVVRLHLNRAWRIFLQIQPAFMGLATTTLRNLEAGALVEEIEVHGGEGWNHSIVIFVTLPYMRSLDFSANGISSLSDENFQRLPNLLHLNLSYNNFLTIPKGVQLLHRLQTLDLSHNPILTKSFAPTLSTLSQLKVLNLSAVALQSLDMLAPSEVEEDAPSYSRLEVLDVSACNLTSVESSLWARASNLRTLRLAANPVASVPPWLAQRLPALQELDLSGCLLAAAPALRLAPAQRLRRLLLARNLLATPRGALAAGDGAGGGAAYLDLSGNPLRGEWGAGAFVPLGTRAAVNLSRAHLTALSPQMLQALEPLAQVDLGKNPFDCGSCSILHLQQWLRNGSSPEVLWLGEREPLRCFLPPTQRGRPVASAEAPSPLECFLTTSGQWRIAVGAVAAAALLSAAILALLACRFRLYFIYVLHVFDVHSKHDRVWVLNELLPQLEESHPPYRLCLHERDFPLGALVVQNIVECMERSRRTLMVLTPSFVQSQWCQWELEMATHRLLEGAGRDFLVLVELQRLEARTLPRLLRLLVETRTFLQWPPGGGGAEGAWRRLRAALGPPLLQSTPPPPSAPLEERITAVP
ncbi:Toll-like receptor Tollo [Gryllus bimaculatus]|nr:Toll-like receptor Tollo [Gryllus bimaculatus]